MRGNHDITRMGSPFMMNLRALQCFVILAEELNFSRAAERLHIAQPALSQQMRQLEERLGVALVDRSRRPLQLTEAGDYFRTHASQMLDSWAEIVSGAHAVSAGTRGWLGVGFTRSALYSILTPALKMFHEAYPYVELKLFEMLTDEQANALRDRRIHIGIGRQPLPMEGCTTRSVLHERFMAVLPLDHALARRKKVQIKDLAGTPLILSPRHHNAQFARSVLSLYRDAGVVPFVAHHAYEIQTAVALAAAGLGVTFVGESIARHGRQDVAFKPLDGAASKQYTVLAATYREDDTSAHLRAFLDCLPSDPLASDEHLL